MERLPKLRRAELKIFVFVPVLLLIILSSRPCTADVNITYSDTNFINSFRDASGRYQAYDFNRFRSEIDLRDAPDKFRINTILDFESYLSRPFIKSDIYQALKDPDPDLPFNPYLTVLESDDALGRFYVYRINAEARFEDSHLIFGLQRVPFGVGRLWNPTDTFNPIDALSVESNERAGVFAANYTQHLSAFSSLQMISNFKKKGAVDKYGFRYKAHHLGMDMGLSFIKNSDFLMAGIELESNLLETGIEVRSELGFFNNDNLDKTYFSGIAGLEYAFPNNWTVLGEYFYNGLGVDDKEDYDTGIFINGNWNLGRHYLGAQATYTMTPLITLSLSSIGNLLDGSFFSGPAIHYSVNDETTLSVGANVYTGEDAGEFGNLYDNTYYIKLESYF